MAKHTPGTSGARKQIPDNAATAEPQRGTVCPVVGIGASAGGLEAFTQLLESLSPDTGMAFVLVQHLESRQGPMFVELLQRATKMRVALVTDGTPIEPNHVYVNPPSAFMRVEGSSLKLEPHVGPQHLPIDRFFQSLAETQGNQAVGIILSGTASDGTAGMKAIKAEGGITFAQDDSAKHSGMPQSAILAGCVDYVLPPEAIAKELGQLSRHPYLKASEEPADKQAKDGFAEIFGLLKKATDVDFSLYKEPTLHRRIQRRMALSKIEDVTQYTRVLAANAGELQTLFQDLLIHVTSFFREPATFEALRNHVFPVMFRERSSEHPVRIWVPGCSTGEEVYSIAILVLEHLREADLECHCQIFGTDLNEAVLAKARAGVYPASIAAEVSPELLRRHFVRSNGGYQIGRAVRDLCIFARQNVTRDPPFSRLDLISCRNLLIYLSQTLQSKVVRIFHYALKPSGFLVLGMSEAVGTAGELFTPIEKQSRIYTKKQALPAYTVNAEPYGEEPMPVGLMPVPPEGGPEPSRMIDHVILSRYSPPAVVLSRDLRILQFRGQTAPYLEHSSGDANLSVMNMSRAGLGLEIRRLVQRAEKKSSTVRSEPLPLPDHDRVRTIRLSVTPIQPPGYTDSQFLVIFEETDIVEPARQPAQQQKGKQALPAPRIEALERELATTKQYLQTVIEEQEAASEELKSANEEIQSSNEELQSTNEELLTAKEELQSTNEELTTLNEEMQSRNTELAHINNDLLNLLSSVNIPILMLGMDLRIRRFTPQAEKIFNLLSTDVGRPIQDLRPKIDVPDLERLCREVVETLGTKEREVQDVDNRVYSMWLRPYRTADNVIDGVVLSLFDVTERKQTAEARYRRMFEAARDGMIIADAVSGEIVEVNPYFCVISGYPRQQFLGQPFWEHPAFRETLVDEHLLRELEHADAVHRSVSIRTAQGAWAEVDLTANLYLEGEKRVVQFNIRDTAPRRQLEESLRRGEEGARHTHRLQAVEEVAGSLAHNFNDLLTTIMGQTALLQQETESAAAAGRGQEIMRAAERAAALTRQLRAFGRRQITIPEPLDMSEVIRDVGQLVRVTVTRGISVEFELPDALGRIHADRGDVEQILLNLAVSAREAMPQGGGIVIRASNVDIDRQFSHEHPSVPPGQYVCLTVADSVGGGDGRRQQGRAFQRFQRQSGDPVEGFGLAALFNLVHRNGGSVLAVSELGRGSTFHVYFPRLDGDHISEHAAKPAGGSETILVVEDDVSVRALACQILGRYGYTAIEASHGEEAVRRARDFQGRIHLMITDVAMPQTNGRELVDRLRSDHPEIRILFVSGHTDAELIEQGTLGDGDSFLAKPYTPQALAMKVREILDNSPAA